MGVAPFRRRAGSVGATIRLAAGALCQKQVGPVEVNSRRADGNSRAKCVGAQVVLSRGWVSFTA
jgi:hypothetical protein